MRAQYIMQLIRNVIVAALQESGEKISGRIIVGERPDGRDVEDIVINCMSLSQYPPPQKGIFNVNIHVPDLAVKIGKMSQNVANTDRIEALNAVVVTALKTMEHEATLSYVSSVLTMKDVNDHYSNIRVEWTAYEFDYYEQY